MNVSGVKYKGILNDEEVDRETEDVLVGRKPMRCLSCNRFMDGMREKPKHMAIDFRKLRSHLPSKHMPQDPLGKKLAEEYHIYGTTADQVKRLVETSPGRGGTRLPPIDHSTSPPRESTKSPPAGPFELNDNY
jgi:hypothetical protein